MLPCLLVMSGLVGSLQAAQLTSVRTVGASGKSLPEGLIRPSNPYETWGNYKERLSNDRTARLSRQRRSADRNSTERVLSRQKRFLSFPAGSFISIEPELFIPVLSEGDFGMNFDTELQIKWVLPNGVLTIGRSSLEGDRSTIYEVARMGLQKVGLDGQACILRAICEAAEYPLENDGLLGEVINIVLTASRATTVGDELSEHLNAEYQGRSYGNCHASYPGCPVSMFNFMSA